MPYWCSMLNHFCPGCSGRFGFSFASLLGQISAFYAPSILTFSKILLNALSFFIPVVLAAYPTQPFPLWWGVARDYPKSFAHCCWIYSDSFLVRFWEAAEKSIYSDLFKQETQLFEVLGSLYSHSQGMSFFSPPPHPYWSLLSDSLNYCW